MKTCRARKNIPVIGDCKWDQKQQSHNNSLQTYIISNKGNAQIEKKHRESWISQSKAKISCKRISHQIKQINQSTCKWSKEFNERNKASRPQPNTCSNTIELQRMCYNNLNLKDKKKCWTIVVKWEKQKTKNTNIYLFQYNTILQML